MPCTATISTSRPRAMLFSAVAGRMVYEAETSVNAALENFTLLGYKA